MVITSSTGKRWAIPKGLVELDMTPQDSAANEAWGEVALIGKVLPTLLGTYEYPKWGGICQGERFLLQVEIVWKNLSEAKKRKREWVNINKAIKRVGEAELKKFIGTYLIRYKSLASN